MIVTLVLLLAIGAPNSILIGTPEWSLATSLAAPAAQVLQQNFIPVEGGSLRSKMESAVRLGRANARNRQYYVAYQFSHKKGVFIGRNYRTTKGERVRDKETNKEYETRNAGIFLLRDATTDAVIRIDIYDLDQPNDFNGYPVYWLGRVSNDESLSFLQELLAKEATSKLADSTVAAIALHEDGRVGQILEGIVRESKVENTRKSAVFWLGQSEGETGFLSSLITNEQESLEVRKQAAFAIGVGKDASALSTLQGLYGQVTNREVKKQIIFANFVNKDSDQAVDFLINVATKDEDRDVRKQAIFWLGQKAGQKAAQALTDTVEDKDGDTEIQKQAVFAISQRKKDESVPMLINIAKTHPKGEVRKQALFWLGQIDDARALELFKEILNK
jgi:HEAT repeat protein